MAHIKKTYAYKAGKQTCFNGHITKETAVKRGFESVTLTILDTSGKGRGENRRFYAPDFAGMQAYS
jgi:hypothetical protein